MSMIMNNRILVILLALCAAVFSAAVLGMKVDIAQALNTYSIDLESGSSQYLSISDASQNGVLDVTSDMTIEAWAKLESLPISGGDWYTIVAKYKGNSASDRSYWFAIANDSGTYKLKFVESSDGASSQTAETTFTGLTTGTWYHVAVVYSNAGTATFYVNGSGVGTQSGGVTSLHDSASKFTIGAMEDNSGIIQNFHDGLIDDIRIWNTVRTGAEINNYKNQELNGNELGLVGYWKLDNSLTDSTSNGNTLTNNGNASFSPDAPFSGFNEVLKVRKSGTQTIANSTTLSADSDLKLSLAANTTYIIDGVIFASSTSATPDIKIAFFGQTGSDIRIGYTNDTDEMVLDSGDESSRISLRANTPTSIHLHGTVTTSGTSGDLVLKWAQATSNAAATAVLRGGYLRAEAI